MGWNFSGHFETRRDAEMTVERLVQEYGVDRADIVVAPVGDTNTAGEHAAGSDATSAQPSTEERHDARLSGQIEVSVDVEDDAMAATIRTAFAEFGAHDVDHH